MRVLVTGATGFLGKEVIKLLLTDERIKKIDVISRHKASHPNPKVEIFSIDLSEPSDMAKLDSLSACDAVIHLAGLYDFDQEYKDNYIQNVLPTLNLIAALKKIRKKIPVYFASTYAVGFGSELLREEPLTFLPSQKIPYAYTKAIAERALSDSGLKGAIFRLGVLVGNSQGGVVEKTDGPYYLMKFLHMVKKFPLTKRLPMLPMPLDPEGFLPLVPVDAAAKVFHESIFRDASEAMKIYSVYDTESVHLKVLVDEIFSEMLPTCKPYFLKNVPSAVLEYQKFLTWIPAPVFEFSNRWVKLENKKFAKDYPLHQIPSFAAYRDHFFSGFKKYMRGELQ